MVKVMQNIDTNESSKRAIKRSKFNFLLRELEIWKEANIITKEQMYNIRAYYEVSDSNYSRILTYLGALLVGAAFLSFIAANWMELGRVAKICLILLIYICSVLSAWVADNRSFSLSRGLLLLSSFVYGGGIFLMAQIFHEGGHFTTALWWWIAGIVPVCVLFKDRLQLYLIQIISVVYFFELLTDFSRDFGASSGILFFFRNYLLWEIALVAGLWALWLYIKERINFNLNVLVTIIFIILILRNCGMTENEIILSLFGLGIIFGFITCEKYKDINVWGVILVGFLGLIITDSNFWKYAFEGTHNSISNNIQNFIVFLDPGVLAVCSGILSCAIMVLFMLKGSALAVFLFCAIILRYFFDKFYDFIPKSIMFTIAGITLVAVGLLMGKIHRNKKTKIAEKVFEEAKRT
jgi:uncharacterized membrane protein